MNFLLYEENFVYFFNSAQEPRIMSTSTAYTVQYIAIVLEACTVITQIIAWHAGSEI